MYEHFKSSADEKSLLKASEALKYNNGILICFWLSIPAILTKITILL